MATEPIQLYDDGADALLTPDSFPDRVSLLPPERARLQPGSHIRLLWGQDMLRDVLDGRYRSIVCSVNAEDNTHGIIAQIVSLVKTSQWSVSAVTSYAKMFQDSVEVHAARDREPYVLKFDLDSVLILGILRPKDQDHFTLSDLARGFQTVARMVAGRADRRPICTVSFLGARSNRLIQGDGAMPDAEPSLETALRTMHSSGFRGDVYAAPGMWGLGDVGVFPSYPFPASIDRMRAGSS
jgi:hypothetical protein